MEREEEDKTLSGSERVGDVPHAHYYFCKSRGNQGTVRQGQSPRDPTLGLRDAVTEIWVADGRSKGSAEGHGDMALRLAPKCHLLLNLNPRLSFFMGGFKVSGSLYKRVSAPSV